MWFSALKDGVSAWYSRRTALAELRSLRREEAPYDSIRAGELVQKVRDGAVRRDHAAVRRDWSEMWQRYPDYAMTAREALVAVVDIGLYDEADEVLSKSVEKYFSLPKIAELWAEVALARGDYTEAIRRWTIVRTRFPGEARAFAMSAVTLKHLGRTQEAEAMLVQAAQIDPGDYVVVSQYAALATEQGDWPEALRRWNLVRERFSNPAVLLSLAVALRELGRQDESIAVLDEARWRFPDDSRALVELAWIAHRRGDWPEALRQWAHLRDGFPQVTVGYIAGAQALRSAGRLEEAEALLLVAVDRLAAVSAEPLVEYARFAHERQDWPQAIRRWEMVRANAPGRRIGYNMGADALEAAGRGAEAVPLRAAAAAIP